MYTVLKDRILFYDGDSVVTPDKVDTYIGSRVCVTELTEEIEKYNSLVDQPQRVNVKDNFESLDYTWNIPQEYLELDVEDFLWDACLEEVAGMGDREPIRARANRLEEELEAYKQMNLIPLLRVIIYIINTLRSHNIVWGIGRGSCVSSYVLYLLGVHDVDSVTFELDYKDFLRTSD